MKASDLFVECLKKEGVEVVFGIPGVATLDVVQSLSESGIRFIPARHESGAAFMADVYGRVTGRAGVCLASCGAAATNLVTALAGATMDHAPVVAITGQRCLARLQKQPYQAIDIVSTLKPVTKWNAQVTRPELIPESVHKAFRVAQTEGLGACHLDLPEDVAREEVSVPPLPSNSLRRPSPPDRVLDGAADLIDEAKQVVILAGHGAVRGDASAELTSFVEDIGLPVLSTPNGKGVLPFDHPNFCYTLDIHCEEAALAPLKEAEVVLAIGYELNEFPPDLWNPNGRAKIIHMSASPSEINRNYSVAVEIIGDIRDSLRNLKLMLRQTKQLPKPNAYKEKLVKLLSEYERDDSYPFKPQRLLADLAKVLGPEDLLLCDMGTHRFWISQLFPAPGAGTVILSQSHNVTGFALPGAIGARVAQPERRIVAVCGDGGFLAGSAELATACAMKLPLVILVFNDNHLSYVRSLQLKRFQKAMGTEVANPDFVALARSFGAQGIRMQAGDSLGDLVQKAQEQQCPTVIEAPVDPRENERIFDNWLEGNSMPTKIEK